VSDTTQKSKPAKPQGRPKGARNIQPAVKKRGRPPGTRKKPLGKAKDLQNEGTDEQVRAFETWYSLGQPNMPDLAVHLLEPGFNEEDINRAAAKMRAWLADFQWEREAEQRDYEFKKKAIESSDMDLLRRQNERITGMDQKIEAIEESFLQAYKVKMVNGEPKLELKFEISSVEDLAKLGMVHEKFMKTQTALLSSIKRDESDEAFQELMQYPQEERTQLFHAARKASQGQAGFEIEDAK